jgi:hypothetical protein
MVIGQAMEILRPVLFKLLGIAFLLLPLSQAHAQKTFVFPKNPGESVTAYLIQVKVADPSRQLNNRERHELCRFFVRAYVVATRRGQEQLLVGARIYQLFEANFPKVGERYGEGGIFLEEIARFINTMSEYRADLEEELRRDIAGQKCITY